MSASPGERRDPLTTFLFGLTITDLGIERSTAFFKSVSGLKAETEVIDYHEGGLNGYPRRLVGMTKWPNIVLKQGFTGDLKLYNWFNLGTPKRVDGTIFLLGHNLEPVRSWKFSKGFPVKWEGPDLDASKNELAIETIEIAHEGWVLA